ncbi:hypothetical protein DPMN_084670 [Dreissena polymorpha]|uniref:Endonuclease/exonuclease/phosphatase domain-containing protein n=1 Tax=Dreissena polymorpha TaxID=45954 RepID=A0A9D3YE92_DREPO|nr:hypothetical protein DPMN_084670 [Dreissena polymorpha]
MGDFNGKSQEWHNSKIDEHRQILEDLLTECNLVTHNDGQATRRNSTSVIDLIITSSRLTTYIKTRDTLTH